MAAVRARSNPTIAPTPYRLVRALSPVNLRVRRAAEVLLALCTMADVVMFSYVSTRSDEEKAAQATLMGVQGWWLPCAWTAIFCFTFFYKVTQTFKHYSKH